MIKSNITKTGGETYACWACCNCWYTINYCFTFTNSSQKTHRIENKRKVPH